MPQQRMPKRKRIALVAHDHKKPDLVAWAKEHREDLIRHELIGTGTTGAILAEALQVPVKRLLSGPIGGDQQLGAMIAEGKVDILIFFWDPLEAQPHDPDVRALLRIAALWNIPCATNRSTADFMMRTPLMVEEYARETPDYERFREWPRPEGM